MALAIPSTSSTNNGLSALQPYKGLDDSSLATISTQSSVPHRLKEEAGGCVVLTYYGNNDASSSSTATANSSSNQIYRLDPDIGSEVFRIGRGDHSLVGEIDVDGEDDFHNGDDLGPDSYTTNGPISGPGGKNKNDLIINTTNTTQCMIKLDKRTKKLTMVVYSKRSGVFLMRKNKFMNGSGTSTNDKSKSVLPLTEAAVGNLSERHREHENSKSENPPGILIRAHVTLPDKDWNITLPDGLMNPCVELFVGDYLVITDIEMKKHYIEIGVGNERTKGEWIQLLHLENQKTEAINTRIDDLIIREGTLKAKRRKLQAEQAQDQIANSNGSSSKSSNLSPTNKNKPKKIIDLEAVLKSLEKEIQTKTTQYVKEEEQKRIINNEKLKNLLEGQLQFQKALEETSLEILKLTHQREPHKIPEMHPDKSILDFASIQKVSLILDFASIQKLAAPDTNLNNVNDEDDLEAGADLLNVNGKSVDPLANEDPDYWQQQVSDLNAANLQKIDMKGINQVKMPETQGELQALGVTPDTNVIDESNLKFVQPHSPRNAPNPDRPSKLEDSLKKYDEKHEKQKTNQKWSQREWDEWKKKQNDKWNNDPNASAQSATGYHYGNNYGNNYHGNNYNDSARNNDGQWGNTPGDGNNQNQWGNTEGNNQQQFGASPNDSEAGNRSATGYDNNNSYLNQSGYNDSSRMNNSSFEGGIKNENNKSGADDSWWMNNTSGNNTAKSSSAGGTKK